MLSLGLTGGIASGKSLVAARLQELGAVLIDADRLARQVVAPGTEGLAAVIEAFGADILTADGALDRPKLGALVFGNAAKREQLNSIIHPRVRRAAAELKASSREAAIAVEDIPLLAETGQAARFHLVLVVDAAEDQQVTRMQENRGMSGQDARQRIAAQASRDERKAIADVVIDNTGSAEATLHAVDQLWQQRIEPFAENLRQQRRAVRGGPALVPWREGWALDAGRLASRIMLAVGERGLRVDHIGSTAVPGLAAKDVIDLQLIVPSLDDPEATTASLESAGFVQVRSVDQDSPKPCAPDATQWQKRFHANQDPGRAVNLHVRAAGSAGAGFALLFRDWLRADPAAREDYAAMKRELADEFAAEKNTENYAAAKEVWFDSVGYPQATEWAQRTNWRLPREA